MLENKSVLTIEEELYCLQYELEILSGIVNHNMLERWLPGYCKAHTHKEHVCRYNWIKEFVKNKNVLDIASGTGFGSYIMATEGGAASVTACDIDERSVRYASYKNRHPHINFMVQNAETFKLDNQFDIVVSFETIEHLNKPEEFLQNVQHALKDGGTFFLSTPVSSMQQNNAPDNIYHVVEWGFKRFQELVGEYFSVKDIYLQLYRFPSRPDNRRLSRVLRKAGVTKLPTESTVEKLDPFKWSPAEISADRIGSEWTGYQILELNKNK